MQKVLTVLLLILLVSKADAQVSITASDMPVKGDTLRYSTTFSMGLSGYITDSGANKTWNFDTLTPLVQQVDEYKTAIQVNPLYAIINLNAYGYKVADSLPSFGMGLPAIKNIYNFFSIKNSPSRFIIEAFAAEIGGAPVPAVYSDEDEMYFFPLAYGRVDSSTFELNFSLSSLGSLKQKGKRITKVDGWGKITTPFYTTPQNCIRVRSEIDAVDSVKISPLPAVGIPRRTVDYKWLVPGQHYPAMWITTTIVGGNETVTSARYRDSARNVFVGTVSRTNVNVTVYPNPAGDVLYVKNTLGGRLFSIEIFDFTGKNVLAVEKQEHVDISNLVPGSYIVRLTSDEGSGYAAFVKR